MKSLITSLAIVGAVFLASGCERSVTEGPGGKKLGVTKPSDQTIKRGETNDVKVSIQREKFRDPVTVRFEDLPAGVKVQDTDRKIAAEDTAATFTLKADDDAKPVESALVKVTVEAPGGMKTSESFKITVKDK